MPAQCKTISEFVIENFSSKCCKTAGCFQTDLQGFLSILPKENCFLKNDSFQWTSVLVTVLDPAPMLGQEPQMQWPEPQPLPRVPPSIHTLWLGAPAPPAIFCFPLGKKHTGLLCAWKMGRNTTSAWILSAGSWCCGRRRDCGDSPAVPPAPPPIAPKLGASGQKAKDRLCHG